MILNREVDDNENNNEDEEKYNPIGQRDEEKEEIYKKEKKSKKSTFKTSREQPFELKKANKLLVFIITLIILFLMIKIFSRNSKKENKISINKTNNVSINNTFNDEINENNSTNKSTPIETIYINETELKIQAEKERLNRIKDELLNIYDKDGKINIIQFYEERIINKSYSKPQENFFNNIHINIGFTDDKIDLIIPHISSILYKSSKNTFLHIHMMDAGNFNYDTLVKLGNMIYSINNLTEIIVYNATQVLKDFLIRADSVNRFSQEYAKLYAIKILKKIKNIIFIDGDDCIVQKDLNELYRMNMDNIYARGITEEPSIRYSMNWMDKYLYDRTHYINCGVVLINLELCQKENFYEKAIALNNDVFYTKTEEPSQDIINVLLRRKIEFFHPKYNKINFYEKEEDKNDESKWYWWMEQNLKIGSRNNHFYTKEELIEADKDPVIIHYAWDRYLYKTVDKYEKEKQFYCNLTRIHI